MSQDDAVALMSSPETVHIEVTDGERTTVVYAIGPDAGTVSWWRAGVLVQEHSLRPSAHHADELYAHKISVHHDGGARVMEWDLFPAYGVVSRQEHHYPAGEHDERTWHTMASADLDLLAVPGPIDPRDVRQPRRRPDCPGSRRPDGATRFSSVLPCGSPDATRHRPRVSSSPLLALRRSTAPATRTGRPCPPSPRASPT